jgi:hypothetical protein
MANAVPEACCNARPEPENEWTIMVFFAGDPHLSPSMTAQLKSIKDAGFQENTTVLVHYDPNEKGVAVTTFNINSKRKRDLLKKGERGTRIGDGRDPFVRNLLEDAIRGARRADNANQALRTFLDIGATRFKAKHYMVFLVGHGVIVGNDAFLPDSSPLGGISLQQLGDTLRHFKRTIPSDAVVDLIGLHSCSMSGIEVLFELKDTAKYMMATEGTSFVASWPYRQLLKKFLNAVEESKVGPKTPLNLGSLITSIHKLSLHNSTDFMFSGLSADLCLSSLDRHRVDKLKTPIENLVIALKQAMIPPHGWDEEEEWRGVELIKLAHLEAQSYFEETYTDLYDFCLCLKRRCTGQPFKNALKEACAKVIEILEEGAPDSVVVQSDHFGPVSQYSHGVSIFFPWARPIQDEPVFLDDNMLSRYENYEFTKALGPNSWLSFLDAYFNATLRKSREDEDGQPVTRMVNAAIAAIAAGNGAANGVVASGIVDALTKDAPSLAKDSPSLEKDSPSLTKDSPSMGTGCGCSVKNYPMKFAVSPRAAEDPNSDAARRAEKADVVASYQ